MNINFMKCYLEQSSFNISSKGKKNNKNFTNFLVQLIELM